MNPEREGEISGDGNGKWERGCCGGATMTICLQATISLAIHDEGGRVTMMNSGLSF